jgi:hypothetical protein
MYETNPLAVADSTQDSDSASGTTATGPGAGTAIATIASGGLPAGRYRIRAETMFVVGTPAAAEDLNIEIRKAAVSLRKLVTGRALNNRAVGEAVATLDGTQALSLNVVAAATAGVAYSGVITAERLGAAATQA